MSGNGSLPRPENTVAVLVTRRPPGSLVDRVAGLGSHLTAAVVVDNGTSGRGEEVLAALDRDPDVRVERLGENRGVAAALNRGLRLACGEGAAWALLLDQDTRPGGRLLEGLRGALRSCPFRERVAVVGANYRNPDTGRLDRTPDAGTAWAERTTVVTAGSLLRLSAAREIGPFREDFFVDQVDHEYCLRARRAGWRVIASTEPLMEHPVGEATVHRLPWGETVTSNHSPVRRYYMIRNHLLLAREYLRDEPRWVLGSLLLRLTRIARLALFERRRWVKLGAVARGVADGLRGRTGRAPTSLRDREVP